MTSQDAYLVRGYDGSTRTWAVGHRDVVRAPDAVPVLEGLLVADPDSLDVTSRDLGRIVAARPGAVLKPRSVADVEAMVAFCSRREIPVSARGEAHTTGGQGLTEGGLIIAMGGLNRIHSITADEVDVDGGVLLLDLVRALADHGLQVVGGLPGYLQLSVAGVVCVGGISADYRRGGVVDAVRALEIVTPAQGRVWCSESARPDLFLGALAGLGQLGVITRVRLAVEPAPTAARVFLIDYTDPAAFFRDTQMLVEREEFHKVYCTVLPRDGGLPVYRLSATILGSAGTAMLTDAHLLRGVATAPTEVVDMTYLQQTEAATHMIDAARAVGWDELQKPWFDEFFPRSTIERFTNLVVPELAGEDYAGPPVSFILLQPQRADGFRRPLMRVPTGEKWFWLFADSPACPPDEGFAARSADRNRWLEAHARPLGGVRYPVGTATWSHDQWREHYGDRWPMFLDLKRRYDPGMIMNRGVGIFPPTQHHANPTEKLSAVATPRRTRRDGAMT